MKWFAFRQNNSGGVWKPPARNILIEARNANEANEIAIKNGVYFEESDDCIICCGYRWYKAEDSDAKDKPLVYDELPGPDDLVIKYSEPNNILKEIISWIL